MSGMTDGFNGDNAHLCRSIEALLNLDAKSALVPHGIGGHGRKLLTAAMARLRGDGEQALREYTMIGHSERCSGCFNIEWRSGDPLAVCNECGHKVELLDSLRDGEGQAVAYLESGTLNSAYPEDLERERTLRPDDYAHWFPVYTRPQPVAGDAPQGLRERVESLPERITGVFTLDAAEFAWLRTALSTQHAPVPTPQQISDYLAMCERIGRAVDTAPAPSEQVAASVAVPEGSTPCWSCGITYTPAQRSQADGQCPWCGAEIELAAAPVAPALATRDGGEA